MAAPQMRALGARLFPAAWMACFLALVFTGTVVSPPAVALGVLGVLGWAWLAVVEREALAGLLRDNRALLSAALILALAILWSEALATRRGAPPSDPIPAQSMLLLCLPVLALFLRDVRLLRGAVLLFCALCAWHFVMMPVEAATGFKLTWHEVHLLPRAMWPFRFQASGLAWQTFCFIGLMLPLFYLAWGPVLHRRVELPWRMPDWAMRLLPLAWLIPAAAVQSRSGLFGAACAGMLAALTAGRKPSRAMRLALLAFALLALLAYLYLFTEGKTGPGLRWAYFKAYMLASLDPQWLAMGRGFSRDAPAPLVVPGLLPLAHSHNDIAQVFFSWGLPALLAYAAFWGALLWTVWTRFVRRGEYWPALALLVLLPNMVTDVGLHFFEKAAFLVLLAGMCLACEPLSASGSGGAFPLRRSPRT